MIVKPRFWRYTRQIIDSDDPGSCPSCGGPMRVIRGPQKGDSFLIRTCLSNFYAWIGLYPMTDGGSG